MLCLAMNGYGYGIKRYNVALKIIKITKIKTTDDGIVDIPETFEGYLLLFTQGWLILVILLRKWSFQKRMLRLVGQSIF